MPPLLTPAMLDGSNAKDLQVAMGKELRALAKTTNGKEAWFLAAAQVPLATKNMVPLFVVAKNEAEVKAWQVALKTKKVSAFAVGTCTLAVRDGNGVQVSLNKVTGDRKSAVKTAQLAFKTDTPVQVDDALDTGAGRDRGPAAVSIPQVTSRLTSAAQDFFASSDGQKAYQEALTDAMKEGKALNMSEADIVAQFDQAWRREVVAALSNPAGWQRA